MNNHDRQWLARASHRLLRPLVRIMLAQGVAHRDFDAIVLACAGLERLELASRIASELTIEQSLPAIGQGVLGIEIRADDDETAAHIAALDDEYTHIRIDAERAVKKRLLNQTHICPECDAVFH